MKINTKTLKRTNSNTKAIIILYSDPDYKERIGRISKYKNGKYIGYLKGNKRTGEMDTWEEAIEAIAILKRKTNKKIYFTFTTPGQTIH